MMQSRFILEYRLLLDDSTDLQLKYTLQQYGYDLGNKNKPVNDVYMHTSSIQSRVKTAELLNVPIDAMLMG